MGNHNYKQHARHCNMVNGLKTGGDIGLETRMEEAHERQAVNVVS